MPLNLVLLKSCDVLGVFWGAWIERDPGHRQHDRDLRWCADGKLSAHVHAVYPLQDARRAQGDRRAQGHGQGDPAALVSRTRSSHDCSAGTFANFGSKGTLELVRRLVWASFGNCAPQSELGLGRLSAAAPSSVQRCDLVQRAGGWRGEPLAMLRTRNVIPSPSRRWQAPQRVEAEDRQHVRSNIERHDEMASAASSARTCIGVARSNAQ